MIYEAEQANDNAELDKAIELYEQAFVVWAEIFDDYPLLTIDDTAEDLFNSVRRYMVAIDSQEIPENFPLATFVTMMGEFGQIDSKTYESVRRETKEAAEKRRIELEEEEKKRQEEAEKAEAAENQSPAATTDKEAADSKEPDEIKPEETAQPESSTDAISNNDATGDTTTSDKDTGSDQQGPSSDVEASAEK